MVAIRVDTFGGMVPAVDDRLLPDRAASEASDVWLYTGRLEPMHTPETLYTCASASITSVYRLPDDARSAQNLPVATWMEFEHPFTNVLRAPVIGDTFERYYWVSPAEQPKYNTKARIESASAEFVLGVPAPGTVPGVTPAGGVSTVNVTRSYVYTWVTAYGEEGPPSDPTTATGKVDDTWAITVTAPGGADETDRNLEKVRVYRTITDTLGNATYYLVTEFAKATVAYNDTQADTAISGNNQLESTSWTAPPTDLEGWIGLPNGIIAGFRDNELWFSEPYRPHAWPAQYTIAVEFPIVGLGVVGQTLVICTTGFPAACSGVRPESMSLTKLSVYEPCLSRGSIVSAPEGVYYASQNGLVLVGNGRVENITRELITKDKWQALASVDTLRAARIGTAYYAYGSAAATVFQEDTFQENMVQVQDFDGAYRGVFIDPQNQRVAFSLLSSTDPVDNVLNDPWTGEVFLLKAGVVYWLDLADSTPTHEVATWVSKEFHFPRVSNLGAAKVFFTIPSTAPALNVTPNTALVQDLAADQYALLKVYVDGVHKSTHEIRESGQLLRLPSGFKGQVWKFELQTRVPIRSLHIASSVKELKSV